MFARHHIAKLAGTAIAVATVGLAAPGTAAADPTDDAFLRNVTADGVNFANPPEVIQKAQVVCAAYSGGLSLARMYPTLGDSAMTHGQAALFMADAVQAYCPKYTDLLSR
jgi:hypothetical protein